MKYIQTESAQRATQGSFSNVAANGTMRVLGKMFGFLKPKKPVEQPEKAVVKAREVTCAEFASIKLQPVGDPGSKQYQDDFRFIRAQRNSLTKGMAAFVI